MKTKLIQICREAMCLLIVITFYGIVNNSVFAQEERSTNLFAEVYNETTCLRREGKNCITMTQALEGIRTQIPGFGALGLYFKQRFGSDANRDYWNNRGELMLGARTRFFRKLYLGLFIEYIQGKYFGIENSENPNPYGSNYEDVRYGLIFWHGWDGEFRAPSKRRYPLSFWDEVYADAIYYKRDRKNYILYLNSKAGVRLLRVYKTVVDIYGTNHLVHDSNADYWNNKAELGFGLRVKPWADIDISLFVETLRGRYFQRSGRYVNPYEQEYADVQLGLLLWYGWGY